MTHGRNHDLACRRVGLGFLVGGCLWVAVTQDASVVPAVAGASCGAWAGVVLSPDLDTKASIPRGRWRAVGLGWLWRPYCYYIPHRSVLSHGPIVGTVLRVVYAYGCLYALAQAVTLALGVAGYEVFVPALSAESVPLFFTFLASAFSGLAMADVVHWILDGAPLRFSRSRALKTLSGKKKVRKIKKRRR